MSRKSTKRGAESAPFFCGSTGRAGEGGWACYGVIFWRASIILRQWSLSMACWFRRASISLRSLASSAAWRMRKKMSCNRVSISASQNCAQSIRRTIFSQRGFPATEGWSVAAVARRGAARLPRPAMSQSKLTFASSAMRTRFSIPGFCVPSRYLRSTDSLKPARRANEFPDSSPMTEARRAGKSCISLLGHVLPAGCEGAHRCGAP